MKKRFLMTLMTIVLGISLAACGGKGTSVQEEPMVEEETVQEQESVAEDTAGEQTSEEPAAADPTALLSAVWDTYEEQDKFYAMGGDVNNYVENAPGAFSLEDTESVTAMLLVPADQIPSIQAASLLMHGMNGNNFTGVAFQMADAGVKADFAAAMHESIKNNQWMCGSPDRYVIYGLGESYVVTAFGLTETMDVFHEKFMAVYPEAEVLVDEKVAN